MKISMTRELLLASTIVAGLGFAAPAFAQTAAAATEERAAEVVVVTGTRIRQPGLVSASPITSIGAGEINRQIARDPEVVLRALGPVFPGNNEGSNNGTNGGATVSLRGLGTNRTLVLVDGKRATPFQLNGSVDLQTIPQALVERIDVVTGGASSVYGTDAVAGVVNFVMRRDFEGVVASWRKSFTSFGDGEDSKLDLTFGANSSDGKGNVTVNLGFADRASIRQDQRPFGLVQFSSQTGLPQGSPTALPPVWAPIGLTVAQNNIWRSQAGIAVGGALDAVPKGPGNSLIPYVEARDGFNFNPDNYYRTGFKRYSASARAHYEVASWAELYGSFDFNSYQTAAQLASSGSFTTPNPIPLGNPFIPQALRTQLCNTLGVADLSTCVAGNAALPAANFQVARRFEEFGPRVNIFDIDAYQVLVGSRGQLMSLDNWSYDLSFQTGKSRLTETRTNWGSQSRLRAALNTLDGRTCLSTAPNVAGGAAYPGGTAPAGTVANCVPIDIFGGLGSVTPAAVSWVNLNAIRGIEVTQEVSSGNVSGDLGGFLKSPWATDRVGVSFGWEYRSVLAGQSADDPSQRSLAPGQPEVLGSGAPAVPYTGSFELVEYNVETSVPLLTDKFLAQSLNLEAGARTTSFRTAGKKKDFPSFKLGVNWEPVSDLRVRAMYQRAVRAPNAAELFAPQVTGLTTLAVDPCGLAAINTADFNTAGTLSNLCRLTGVTSGQVGAVPNPPANQAALTSGGNPLLGPEKADTYTLGVVYQPSFVKGLTVNLDWYDIEINGAIVGVSATDVTNGCYSAALNPTRAFNGFCSLIERGPTGGLTNARGIVSVPSNLGFIKTSGVDFGATYSIDLESFGLSSDWGRISTEIRGTWTDSFQLQNLPTVALVECMGNDVGYYGGTCGLHVPKFKFEQSSNWSIGDFQIGYRWRHYGKGEILNIPALASVRTEARTIESYNYLDLNGQWEITETFTLNAAVRNTFDKDPPALGGGFSGVTTSGNTLPSIYDSVGREYILSVSARF
jgi:iron complex outermembrane recepter protein